LLRLNGTLATRMLVSITCDITEYELQLRKDIKEMKKELSSISMMDEFAQYAKTERRINKLQAKLQQCSSARCSTHSQALSARACLKFYKHSSSTLL